LIPAPRGFKINLKSHVAARTSETEETFMQFFSSTPRALGLALLAALIAVQSAHGEAKGDKVTFETVDGVKIVGTYWASKDGKKAPVAILLHDFKANKGGTSHDDGWDSLAAALNDKGFAVLQFDFRGHGDSTTVNAMQFWMYPHNARQIRGFNPAKPPESIGQGSFLPNYFLSMVNDIAAAKAFLDRKNDGGELNGSNTVVIGAGQGATLGALWLASEFHKKRGVPQIIGMGAPILDPRFIKFDPAAEGKDVRGAIWLSMATSVEGRVPQVSLQGWLVESGKTNKVPMAFVYGKDDKTGDADAARFMRMLIPGYSRGTTLKDNPLPLSGERAIEKTKLTGSKLLQKGADTEAFIVNFVTKDLKDNLREEWRDRDTGKSKHYWLFANGPNPAAPPFVIPAKNENDLAPALLPLNRFGLQ
jgi:pimeloyl-ACP methyl ester carboxylesterase